MECLLGQNDSCSTLLHGKKTRLEYFGLRVALLFSRKGNQSKKTQLMATVSGSSMIVCIENIQ